MSARSSPARTASLVLVRAAATAVVVSAVVFAAVSALPSDAAETRTGSRADAETLRRLRETLGLDAPLWQRWGQWTAAILRGDWGRSLVTDRPVADLLLPRLEATAVLTAAAVLLALPLMFALGWAIGGSRPGWARRWAALSTTVSSIPQVVVVAGLVVVLSALLGWLPPVSLLPPGGSPLDRPDLLVLPSLALALPAAAWGGGLLGGAVADACAAPHVRDAVARGVTGPRLHVRHVLPFVLSPAIRAAATLTAGTVTAAAVVETMLGYQGLGELLVTAVAGRDTPVVAAVGLIGALIVVAGTALADLAASAADVRRERR
ncbi:ABC transporter permease subunit [Amycolatopsis sp. NPDC049868]|uniref:ABC transporter permease subunit n=1 Tax=Amycolatopsis sp. NPDC049868 TaxID=3363934 RepID=UPI0037B64357